jgi:hypothetical protein
LPAEVRKRHLVVDELWHGGGPTRAVPVVRCAVGVVVTNPFAGRYEDALTEFMQDLEPLAVEMVESLAQEMSRRDLHIESFGKASVAGVDGEDEHAAMWHAPGGNALRRVIPNVTAGVPGVHKVANLGAQVDVPLGSIVANNVRSHYDSLGFTVSDAPRAGELLLVLAVSSGGRVHHRLGGVTVADARSKALG